MDTIEKKVNSNLFWWYVQKGAHVAIHTQVFGSALGYTATDYIQRPIDASIKDSIKSPIENFVTNHLKTLTSKPKSR